MKIPFFKSVNYLDDIGYKADQEGIMNRCIREKNNWKEHLKNSSDYIIRFCDKLPADSTIAILGSGWLLDVPIEYLMQKCARIYLVDMCHPVQVKHKYKDKTKIVFVEKDLTGYASDVAKIANNSDQRTILESLNKLPHLQVLADLKYDALISVNILTQLDSLLRDYIRSINYFPEEKLKAFQQKLQSEHLKLLFNSPSCLISDVEEVYLSRNDSVVFREDTLAVEWPQGSFSESWNWVFDSKYTYHSRYKANLSVKAEMLF